MNLRRTALDLFLETLRGLNVAEAMQLRIVRREDGILIGEQTYRLQDFRRVLVVAIGKAAGPMSDALVAQIAPALKNQQTLEGVIVGASTPAMQSSTFRFFAGEHPVPGQTSGIAAKAILQLLAGCDEACLVFFLISGGASAMVELALDNQFSLEDTADFHRTLVHSGLPITTMNVLRKHFSQVKGGRLAVAAQRAAQCTLMISDVPGDALHIVGSGPSVADPSTVEECRQIVECNSASLRLSDRLLEFFLNPSLEETPKPDHPAFRTSNYLSLLSSDDLCALAGKAAAAKGFHVEIDNCCDEWDYQDAAKYLLMRLEQLRKLHPRVCLISAGEVLVQLPPQHGIGGRNQQFVLECTRLLAEKNLSGTVLSGGSDGADGNSSAAGAVGDETTVARAAARGMDAIAAIERFDSAPVFAALGDAIVTGPTGNNVRDLRILISSA